MKLFREFVDQNRYLTVSYYLSSKKSLADAALAVSIGQSVGNPGIRLKRESNLLIEEHAAIILHDEKQLLGKKRGKVNIAYPTANFDFRSDGITQLLVTVMGGQLDIDTITACHVNKISPPEGLCFPKPKYGISGIREITGIKSKPLLGGIVKPKIGMKPRELLEVVKEMVEGGVNFIKEDEIMANPSCCPLEKRVPLIMDYLQGKPILYAVCVNADHGCLLERVRRAVKLGANAIHLNWWAGLGAYKSIRELDLPVALFFQKSGDRIITDRRHRFHIDFSVIVEIAGLSGVDMMHVGMWGGYLSQSEKELNQALQTTRKYGILPSLSCGMHPGLVRAVTKRFGTDYLVNSGGAIHGHPGGTTAGVKAFRQAIDGINNHEYQEALSFWGEVS
jgi:ribulose-bisphosphate carboxylase large chain